MNNPFADVHFAVSALTPRQLPPDRGAEVAFVGRSNAGKSSAINAITGHRGLARTSKTPGRTRALNVFNLDEHRRLVDLPGFGYARAAKEFKHQWQQALRHYLERRRSLRGLVLVMDVRRSLAAAEYELLQWSRQAALPVHILLTKSDKLGRAPARAALQQVASNLLSFRHGVSVQLFSASRREGVDQTRAVLADWLRLKKSPGKNKGRKPGA
ncbi:MAG: ribosome biogenesis GTP-binding protein YihA/YsxC [Acidiferrobacterales bacterium]